MHTHSHQACQSGIILTVWVKSCNELSGSSWFAFQRWCFSKMIKCLFLWTTYYARVFCSWRGISFITLDAVGAVCVFNSQRPDAVSELLGGLVLQGSGGLPARLPASSLQLLLIKTSPLPSVTSLFPLQKELTPLHHLHSLLVCSETSPSPPVISKCLKRTKFQIALPSSHYRNILEFS